MHAGVCIAQQVSAINTTLSFQVKSSGEAFVSIGGSGGLGPELLTDAELANILKRVGKEMGEIGADMTVLRERKVPSNTEAVGERQILQVPKTVDIVLLFCTDGEGQLSRQG